MANASIRPAAVAGHFYPSDPRVLRLQLTEMLGNAVPLESLASAPKALIAPHAGYMYSGPIAASAYAPLQHLGEDIRKVILLGPAHRVPVKGVALPAALNFETPLGEVAVDREHWTRLQLHPAVVVSDAAHAFEHALEVHVPFLQTVLQHFTLLPLVVGDIAPEPLAELIESLWGGPETLIVVSSDLSHYQAYDEARSADRSTCDQILRLEPRLDHDQACGATPVNGLLRAASRHRLTPQLLDLRNSGDTAGQRDHVVGYASFAFSEDDDGRRH